MRTTLTLLFIRKLFMPQTARHQNKYGGHERLLKRNVNIAIFNMAGVRQF